MYLIPSEFRVSSLHALALKALFQVIRASQTFLKSDEDIRTAKEWLNDLPAHIRIELAKYWFHYWGDLWDYEVDRLRQTNGFAWAKYASWRVACFHPELKDADIVLQMVGYDEHKSYDYGARALRYLARKNAKTLRTPA